MRSFVDEFSMTFPILLDTAGAVYLKYGVFSIPTAFFIDSSGFIRHVQVGALTSDLMAQKLALLGVEPWQPQPALRPGVLYCGLAIRPVAGFSHRRTQ